MTKDILLIVKSTSFNCELKLSEKKALRLIKNIIKYHRFKASHYLWKDYRGEFLTLTKSPAPEESISVEFKHI